MQHLNSTMNEYWQPATVWVPRPSQADARQSIVRTFFIMRLANGVLGLLLPLVVIFGDILWFQSGLSLRGSVSAYYHSDMRDVFVGILSAVGFFLILHRLFERHFENIFSVIAGFAAIGVALFPTSADGKSEAVAHGVFAILFITCLGAISALFGVQEGKAPQLQGERMARQDPRFWKWFHWSMAGLIALAGFAIIVMRVWDASGLPVIGWLDEYSVLVGEIMVAFAFGLSWLMKGIALELDLLDERRASKSRQHLAADLKLEDAA